MSAQRMFYAVARGRATGVFGSWPEAERLVSGFAGARFKKFKSQSEAAAFVRGSPAPQTRASSTTKPKRTTYKPPRGTVAVYTDGGCRGNQNVDSKRDQPAGWGFIAVRDGKVLAERWGPVVIDSGHAHYLGAEKKSNNTGELSGVAEALLWLRDEEGPKVSRATVYRTIALLVEGGFVESLDTGTGELLYEHTLGHRHHDHLVCEGCGRIEEFFDERIERLQEEVAASKGFELVSHSMRLFGRCASCARKRAAKERKSPSTV